MSIRRRRYYYTMFLYVKPGFLQQTDEFTKHNVRGVTITPKEGILQKP